MNISDLEKDFYSIDDLKSVAVEENNEPLVDLSTVAPSIVLVIQKDNIPFTGNTIYVRESVAEKLKGIHNRITEENLKLKVTDGYRPLEVQEEYWQWRLEEDRKQHPDMSEEELENYSIRFTAKPEYAHHTTGGAVDLTLVDAATEEELDMGTPIDEFSEKAYAFYPNLSGESRKNREFLFDLMKEYNFYNFPSEWWHFSYGTRDWALFYGKPHAIYDAVQFSI